MKCSDALKCRDAMISRDVLKCRKAMNTCWDMVSMYNFKPSLHYPSRWVAMRIKPTRLYQNYHKVGGHKAIPIDGLRTTSGIGGF